MAVDDAQAAPINHFLMIAFVNAKINIGLDITARRSDGYHDLSTVFYPVGVHSGEPDNPDSFADALEIVERAPEMSEGAAYGSDSFLMLGRKVDCPLEKNLVVKAANLFHRCIRARGLEPLPPLLVTLQKHLPDGAGLGGGSADASFTLRMLNDMAGNPFSRGELVDMAAGLGADCPFFIYNECCYASGIGERLEPLPLDLRGKWLAVVKPPLYVSTAEAFAGVTPKASDFDLRQLPGLPIREWRGVVRNDFETSLFPRYPELPRIKSALYEAGALFALMSGSGSSVYGIFDNKADAEAARSIAGSTQSAVWLLRL